MTASATAAFGTDGLREALRPAPAMTPTLHHVFDLLVAAAVAGERCPTQNDIGAALKRAGLPQGKKGTGRLSPTTALALIGRIRVRVHGHDWRVVEILAGPHAGMAPNGWAYFLVIDRRGTRRVET